MSELILRQEDSIYVEYPWVLHSDGNYVFVTDWLYNLTAYKIVGSTIVHLFTQNIPNLYGVYFDGTYVLCLRGFSGANFYSFSESGLTLINTVLDVITIGINPIYSKCIKADDTWHIECAQGGMQGYQFIGGNLVKVAGITGHGMEGICFGNNFVYRICIGTTNLTAFSFDGSSYTLVDNYPGSSLGIITDLAISGTEIVACCGSNGIRRLHHDIGAGTITLVETKDMGYSNHLWGDGTLFYEANDSGLYIWGLDPGLTLLYSDTPTDNYNYGVWGNGAKVFTGYYDDDSGEDGVRFYEIISSSITDLDFVADKISDFAPAEINFTCSYVSTLPLTFLWDFGDGQTSTDENPTHTFIRGTYKIKLTVTDGIQTVFVEKYNYIDSYTLDTFYISTIEELQDIGTPGDAVLGVPGYALHDTYVQINDIDASATSTWHSGAGFVPIPYYPDGTVDFYNVFSGVYDGDGYSISYLYINRSIDTGIGLFSNASESVIRDASLNNINITGVGYVGGFIGIGRDSNTIENCFVSGEMSNSSNYTGGFVGYSEQLEITESHSEVDITGQDYVGGFVGLIDSGTLDSCSFDSSISGNSYVGGIAGSCDTVTTSYCAAEGTIQGTSDYVGGILGVLDEGSISNCLATLDVTGQSYVGGIVGYGADSLIIESCDTTGTITIDTDYTYAGGIAGFVYDLEISNCNAEMNIVAGDYIGGCVGMVLNSGFISGCYAACTITGNSYNGGIVGYSYASVYDCSFNGDINVVGGYFGVGGIVGYYQAAGVVENCHASGSMANSQYSGGLIGYCNCDGLKNCYSTMIFLDNPGAGTIYYFGGLAGFFNRYTFGEECSIINCYCTSDINGYNNIGGLIGYASYVTDIINSYSTGEVQMSSAFGGQIGGLCGYANVNGNVQYCYHIGDVNGLDSGSYIGGIFGNSFISGNSINNCYAIGDVYGSGNFLGTFSGYISGSFGVDISMNNCSGTGNVTGNNGGYCGLIGYLDGSFTVEDCFHEGSVENPISGFSAGGLIGFCRVKRLYKCFSIGNVIGAGFGTGGLIGYAAQLFGTDSTEIEQCFSLGNVTANNALSCGGFIGHSEVVECLDCFCQGDVKCYISSSSASYVGGIFGYHNAPLKMITNCYFSGKIETELP